MKVFGKVPICFLVMVMAVLMGTSNASIKEKGAEMAKKAGEKAADMAKKVVDSTVKSTSGKSRKILNKQELAYLSKSLTDIYSKYYDKTEELVKDKVGEIASKLTEKEWKQQLLAVYREAENFDYDQQAVESNDKNWRAVREESLHFYDKFKVNEDQLHTQEDIHWQAQEDLKINEFMVREAPITRTEDGKGFEFVEPNEIMED